VVSPIPWQLYPREDIHYKNPNGITRTLKDKCGTCDRDTPEKSKRWGSYKFS